MKTILVRLYTGQDMFGRVTHCSDERHRLDYLQNYFDAGWDFLGFSSDGSLVVLRKQV